MEGFAAFASPNTSNKRKISFGNYCLQLPCVEKDLNSEKADDNKQYKKTRSSGEFQEDSGNCLSEISMENKTQGIVGHGGLTEISKKNGAQEDSGNCLSQVSMENKTQGIVEHEGLTKISKKNGAQEDSGNCLSEVPMENKTQGIVEHGGLTEISKENGAQEDSGNCLSEVSMENKTQGIVEHAGLTGISKENEAQGSLEGGLSHIIKKHKNVLIRNPESLFSKISDISQEVLRLVFQESNYNVLNSVEIPPTLSENVEKLLHETYSELAKLDTAKAAVISDVGNWNATENKYHDLYARLSKFIADTASKSREIRGFPRKVVIDSICEAERILGSIDSIKGLVCCEINGLELFEEKYKKALSMLDVDVSAIWTEKGVLVSLECYEVLLGSFMAWFREHVNEMQKQDNASVLSFLINVNDAMERVHLLNELIEPTLKKHGETMNIIREMVEKPLLDQNELQSLLQAYDEITNEIQIASNQTNSL